MLQTRFALVCSLGQAAPVPRGSLLAPYRRPLGLPDARLSPSGSGGSLLVPQLSGATVLPPQGQGTVGREKPT